MIAFVIIINRNHHRKEGSKTGVETVDNDIFIVAHYKIKIDLHFCNGDVDNYRGTFGTKIYYGTLKQ